MIRKRRRRQREDEEGGELPVALSPDFEVTPGLVPVGIPNFYQSPAEPVDPRDCDRWPNSPYCGGIPFSTDRADLGVDFSANPCEICVTITPVLGFVELPPYTICYRRDSPECRPPQPDPPPPSVEPGTPAPYQKRCADGSYHYIGTTIEISLNGQTYPIGTDYNTIAKATFDWQMGEHVAVYGQATEWRTAVSFVPDVPTITDRRGMSSIYRGIKLLNDEMTFYDLEYADVLISGSNWLGKYTYLKDIAPPDAMKGKEGGFSTSMNLSSIVYFNAHGCDEVPNTLPALHPPYPLPPRERGCCMACGDSEELLRLIAKRLGTNDYPIAVPQSLLADRGSGKKTIESLSQFLHWFVLQVDSVTGQFPVELEIKDNDPTKEGDQREKITIPNLAEGIAEILGASVNANINTQTLINAGIRTLVEAGSAKIHALETRYISQAIADYLAFDATEVKTPVGMTFTAGKTQLDEILQESEQKLPLYTYSDDRDFKAEMTELLFAAAVIRAVHYRKVTGDPKEDLKQRFKDLIKFAESEISPPSSGDDDQPKPKTDFDNFLEQVETGFINTPGIDDATNPYGRPYSERPRIRELGNTADNTDVSI